MLSVKSQTMSAETPEVPVEGDSLTDRETDAKPEFTLHPIRGIVWAALWGTPVAAGVVLALNYICLGRKTAACYSVLAGLIVTGLFWGLMNLRPEGSRFPNFMYLVPLLWGVYFVVTRLQRRDIQQHLSRGGTVAPSWPSIGIGLTTGILIAGIALWADSVLAPSYGSHMAFGRDEVYYSDGATEDDAKKLGAVLQKAEYFDSSGDTARIQRSHELCSISFIVADNTWDDPDVVEYFRALGETVSEQGFPRPVMIQLCDQSFKVKRWIEIDVFELLPVDRPE